MRDDETRDLDECMLDEIEATDLLDETDGASEATDEDVEGFYALLAKLNKSLKD